MNVAEAARLLGVSTQRVHMLRGTPGFPPMEKLWNEYVLPREAMASFARTYRVKGRKTRE